MLRKIKVCCPECDIVYEIRVRINDHPTFCCFCGEDLPNADYEDELDDES